MTKQAGSTGGAGRGQGMAAMRGVGPAVALGLTLSGCAALNPAGWFHRQEGGVIAHQTGKLPGANQPYPNLASVPPVPKTPNLAALRAISAGLISDRAHAHHLAEAAPLPDPSRPSTAPALFGVGSLPAPGAGAANSAPGGSSAAPPPGASAVIPAVTAAPAPAKPAPPPAKAPVATVQSAALAAPPAASPASAPPPAPSPRAPSPRAPSPGAPSPGAPSPAAPAARPTAAPAAPGALPALPKAPPALPRSAAATPGSGPSMPAQPGPPPPPATATTAGAVNIRFAPGSAALPSGALQALRALAASRGGRMVAAIGHGDAASARPTDQLAATKLGLARARAIARALVAAGVPGSFIVRRADASGQGGQARLE